MSDLLATSPEEWDHSLGIPCKLELPPHYSPAAQEWHSMHLHVLPPSEVRASLYEGRPSQLSVDMPSVYDAADHALASAEVHNRAATYSSKQDALQRQLQKLRLQQAAAAAAAEAGAAAAPHPQPDSQTEFQRKYGQLRNEVMAELQAALLATLRQALRYRGAAEFPAAPPPLPPAAAAAAAPAAAAGAAGQQADEQDGDAAGA